MVAHGNGAAAFAVGHCCGVTASPGGVGLWQGFRTALSYVRWLRMVMLRAVVALQWCGGALPLQWCWVAARLCGCWQRRPPSGNSPDCELDPCCLRPGRVVRVPTDVQSDVLRCTSPRRPAAATPRPGLGLLCCDCGGQHPTLAALRRTRGWRKGGRRRKAYLLSV